MRNCCTSGMFEGQIQVQLPHSKQSPRWYFSPIRSYSRRAASMPSVDGLSPIGQDSTHSPHLMQG